MKLNNQCLDEQSRIVSSKYIKIPHFSSYSVEQLMDYIQEKKIRGAVTSMSKDELITLIKSKINVG